jgi:Ca-activated chloride channel family protein
MKVFRFQSCGMKVMVVAILTAFLFSLGTGLNQANVQQDTIKLETILVQVPVIVSTSGGRYITDLGRQEFTIYEDGVKQDIEFFGAIEEPFNVALVLDSSGSTAAQLDVIKSAAFAFVENMRPDDKIMVIAFNDSVSVLCNLTSDRKTIRQAIQNIKSGEFTQVYEAIYTAVWDKFREVEGRKAVLIFSDFIDTASSEIAEEDTLDAVIESEDVIIYPVRFSTRADVEQKLMNAGKAGWEREQRELDRVYRQADEYLHQLADLSGGVIERADRLSDLKPAFARIANELRHQYLLGYYPANSQKRNEERKIKVKVAREGVKVRARPSFKFAN